MQEYAPHAIVKSVMDVVAPSSFLVVSHALADARG